MVLGSRVPEASPRDMREQEAAAIAERLGGSCARAPSTNLARFRLGSAGGRTSTEEELPNPTKKVGGAALLTRAGHVLSASTGVLPALAYLLC